MTHNESKLQAAHDQYFEAGKAWWRNASDDSRMSIRSDHAAIMFAAAAALSVGANANLYEFETQSELRPFPVLRPRDQNPTKRANRRNRKKP